MQRAHAGAGAIHIIHAVFTAGGKHLGCNPMAAQDQQAAAGVLHPLNHLHAQLLQTAGDQRVVHHLAQGIAGDSPLLSLGGCLFHRLANAHAEAGMLCHGTGHLENPPTPGE